MCLYYNYHVQWSENSDAPDPQYTFFSAVLDGWTSEQNIAQAHSTPPPHRSLSFTLPSSRLSICLRRHARWNEHQSLLGYVSMAVGRSSVPPGDEILTTTVWSDDQGRVILRLQSLLPRGDYSSNACGRIDARRGQSAPRGTRTDPPKFPSHLHPPGNVGLESQSLEQKSPATA